jgi:hypothetical protein
MYVFNSYKIKINNFNENELLKQLSSLEPKILFNIYKTIIDIIEQIYELKNDDANEILIDVYNELYENIFKIINN